MKRLLPVFALFSSIVASATDVSCPGCAVGAPYPMPGYPSPGYPSPDYPIPSYPQPMPPPSYPQPSYPPSYPQPMPPPRACNTATTCDSACQWRPNANAYQQICTVVNCRGEVVEYQARMCVPTDQPAPQPRPQPQPQPTQQPRPQPQPQQPTNPGQDQGQQKPGVHVIYEATANTIFKADPMDSSQVSQQRKCMMTPGTIIEGKILAVRADKLIKLVLTADIDRCDAFGKKGQIGFVYAPHMLER